SLSTLFNYPTIKAFAKFIDENTDANKPAAQAIEKRIEADAPVERQPDTVSGSDTAAAIGAIWQEVLGVDRVAPEDDFFMLGGHSLLLPKLMAKVEKLTGKKLPLTSVFKHPTLGQFVALYVDKKSTDTQVGGHNGTVVDRSADSSWLTWVPTIDPQKEIWITSVLGGDEANQSYNLTLSQRFKGEFSRSVMEKSIQHLVDRHESLRCKFSEDGMQMGIFAYQQATIYFQDISHLTEDEQQ